MNKISLVLTISLAALLGACGKEEAATPESSVPAVAEVAAPAAAPEAAPAMADSEHGRSVFNKTCALCHAVGAAGAPIPGNKDEWGPRIAQGKDVLYKHAMEGFTGSKGVMPPRGGAATLSDDDVKAGVDYMVGKSE
ncbi:MAG: c-type cytochrome [Thiobacillus sp.]